MSRIRTVKPEFWSNEQVMNCSTNARLLFIGLWNFVDDAGRHALAFKQIKALVFPGDDFSTDFIRGLFDELSSNGLLRSYVVDGKEYFQVTGWHHQKIDRPQPSKIPPPPVAVVEQSTNDRSGREGKVEEGNGGEEENPSGREDAPDEFSEKAVFGYGKAHLGKSAGGVIANLKKHHGGDLRKVKHSLEQASTKENPMEYVQAILRQPAQDDWRRGAI